MALSASGLYSLMLVMLISGAANTILMKYQTRQFVAEEPNGEPVEFDHPYLQTLCMMIGELGCLGLFFAFLYNPARNNMMENWNQRMLFVLPVLCDMTATTLVNYAFLLIPASVVQMTRGAIVFFTCLFSVVFLKRKQHGYHLVGVACVCTGITLVAFSQLNAAGSFTGIMLCLVAQAFQAGMLVIEEKVLHSFHVAPLLAVGLEGLYGCIILSLVIPVMSATGNENVSGAFHQMSESPVLLAAVVASIFSIGFFNWSGITVTSESSAVARSTLDCSRTILVWIWELAFGWSSFKPLQLGGFILLAIGTMLYNKILPIPEWMEAKEEDLEIENFAADESAAEDQPILQKKTISEDSVVGSSDSDHSTTASGTSRRASLTSSV